MRVWDRWQVELNTVYRAEQMDDQVRSSQVKSVLDLLGKTGSVEYLRDLHIVSQHELLKRRNLNYSWVGWLMSFY